MIRPIKITLNASFPEVPLIEATTFVGSPSAVFITGVPKTVGLWRITAVKVVAHYPDDSATTALCVKGAAGVWTATLPATATSGRVTHGFEILADGTDENGNAVTGYVLGYADFAVFTRDMTIDSGGTLYYMHYFDALPQTPKKGDVAPDGEGGLQLYNGTAWVPMGGYTPPTGGIPKTDLSEGVQASLDKADTAIQTVKVNGTALVPDGNKAVDVTVPQASTSTPVIAGTANAGLSNAYSRGDHVHPAETEVVAYRLPDDCFPVTYTYDGTDYTITNNDGLIFDASAGCEVSDVATGIFISVFNLPELTWFAPGWAEPYTITNLKFANTSPATNTWPILEKDAVFVREVQVAKEADVKSDIYAAVQQIAPAWVSGTTYAADAKVSYNGVVYARKTSGSITSSTNPTGDPINWEAKKVSELFLPLTGGTMSGPLKVDFGNSYDAEIKSDGSKFGLWLNNRAALVITGLDGALQLQSEDATVRVPTASGTLALLHNIGIETYESGKKYADGNLVHTQNAIYRCIAVESSATWIAAEWLKLFDTTGTLAPLASPAFTGTPTAPTPTAQSGDTQVATKKYVDDAVAGAGGGGVTAVSVASGGTFGTGDLADGKVEMWRVTCAGAYTPSSSWHLIGYGAWPAAGSTWQCTVWRIGSAYYCNIIVVE